MASTSNEQGQSASQGNILVVDDDKFLVDMYGLKFRAAGFTVHGCASVDEALEVLRKGFAADAVLFDLLMPGKDGFAFLEALRSEHLASKAVFIALTNQSNDEDQKHAQELGADRFIVKASMIPSEVVEAVKAEIAKGPKAKA